MRALTRRGLVVVGRLAQAIVVTAVFLVALVAGLLIHLDTKAARATVRRVVTDLVSAAIPGRLEVTAIESLGVFGLEGASASVTAPDGEEVIRASGIDASFNLFAIAESLWRERRLPIPEVHGRRGWASLRGRRWSQLAIARAFTDLDEPPSADEETPGKPLMVVLERITFDRIDATGAPETLPFDATLRDAEVRLSIGEPVVVDVRQVALTTEGAPREMEVDGLVAIVIRAGDEVSLEGSYAGRIGPVPVTADGVWGENEPVDLRLHAGPVSGSRLAGLVPGLRPRGPIEVEASAHGPIGDLAVKADAALGAAGRLSLEARLRDGDGEALRTEGRLDVDHLDLAGLVAGAPPSDITASAQLIARFAEEITASADVVSAAGRLAGERLPPVTLRARYADEEITIDAEVREPGLVAHVDGRFRLRDPLTARGKIDLDEVSLDVLPMLPPKLGGVVRGQATASYRLTDGGPGVLDASLDLTGDGLRYGASSVGRLDLGGSIRGPLDALRYDLEGRARDLAIEGRQRFVTAQVRASGRLDRGVALQASAQRGEGLVDQVEAQTELRLRDGTPRLTEARVSAQRAGATIEARADLVDLGDRPRVEGLEVTAPGIGAEARLGQGPGGAWSIELEADAVSLADLAALFPAARDWQIAGEASVDADLLVGPRRLEGRLDLAAQDVALFGVPIQQARLELRGRPGALDLALEAKGGAVEALSVDASDLRYAGAPFERSSYLGATGEVRSTLRLDLATAPRWLRRIGVTLPPLPRMDGRLSTRLDLSRRPGESAPSGRLRLDVEETSVTPQGQFARALEEASWPDDLVFTSLGAHLEVSLSPISELMDLELRIRDRHGLLFRADGDLGLPYREVWAGLRRGRPLSALPEDWWRDAPVRLWAELPRRSVVTVPWLRDRGIAGGDLRVVASVEGSLEDPSAELRIRSFGLELPGSPVAEPLDLVVIGELDAHHSDARVKLFSPDRQLLIAHGRYRGSLLDHAFGWGTEARDWTADAHLQICEVDLGSLTPLQAYRAQGIASGTVQIRNVHGAAPRLDADLTVDDLTVGDASYRSIVADVAVDRERASVDVEVRQKDGGLKLRGRAPTDWRAALPSADLRDARASMKADAFDLRGLLPFFEGSVAELAGRLSGELEARVRTNGQDAPVLDGSLRLQDGRLQLATVGTRFSNIDAELHADERGRLLLDHLRAESLNGRLEASGEAQFDGLAFARGHLDFEIPEDDPIPVVIVGQSYGRASLTGSVESLLKDGALHTDVHVEKLRVELPRVLGQEITALKPAEHIRLGTFRDGELVPIALSPDEEETSRQGMPLHFDLRIDDAELRRRGLAVWLRGRPNIVVDETTRVTGAIEILGGRLEVQGRSFDVAGGTIDFDNQPTDNPVVDVEATWTAPEGTKIIAQYVGPVKTGSVQLRSEPARPKSEILALLVFGDANHQIGGGDGGTQTQAVGIGGSVLASGLNEALDDLVDLDISASVDTTSSSNPEAELEWRVARSFSLSIARVLGIPDPGESPDQTYAGIEWQFAHEWSLETTVGDQGSTSVDVLWQHSY